MGKVIELKGKPLDLTAPAPADEGAAMDADLGNEYSLFDLGNAERFSKQHEGTLLYCDALGWLIWDGKRWAPNVNDRIMKYARLTVKSLRDEAFKTPRGDKQDAAYKLYAATCKRERLRAMIDISRHMLAAGIETFDSDPYLLNCRNGTMDLRTGAIKDADPKDRITKLVDITYDEKAKSPRFQKFLREIFKGDRELIRYIQRAIGYSMTGSQAEECLFILQGDGRNGKTTLVQTMLAMLGKDYADAARSELIMHQRFDNTKIDNAGLRGKRFISISETNAGKHLNEEVVKTVTGREPLIGKLLYKDQFTFLPTHHIWLYSNYRPKIRGRDDGIWSRIRLIPFKVKFEGEAKDKTLGDKLAAEREGILAWAIAGAVAWWNNGNPGLGECKVIEDETLDYREKEDVLKQYMNDRVVADPSAQISITVLFKDYKAWAEERKYFPWNINTFSESLPATFESKKTNKGAVRIGLRLKSAEELTAEDMAENTGDSDVSRKRKFQR